MTYKLQQAHSAIEQNTLLNPYDISIWDPSQMVILAYYHQEHTAQESTIVTKHMGADGQVM